MIDWFSSINLPTSARAKLAAPIRHAINEALNLPRAHSLPIRAQIWLTYADSIISKIEQFQNTLNAGPRSTDFNSIRDWVELLLDLRNNISAVTCALGPFEHFNEHKSREMLGLIDMHLMNVGQQIEGKTPPRGGYLEPTTDWLVAIDQSTDFTAPILRAFSLETADLEDESGEFVPGRVLAAYYLHYSNLLEKTFPHILSLSLPPIEDILVIVATVGWITGADDPVAAYCSMNALFRRLMEKRHSSICSDVLTYLKRVEPELRQARRRINKAAKNVQNDDEEETLFALADLYRRLIEGPFRKYAWVLHCLDADAWSDPPMLAQLRDNLASQKDWLGGYARQVILSEIRNGEAHETIVWDGVTKKYMVEGVGVEPQTVGHAALLAEAFARGCETALACYKSLDAAPRKGRPLGEDLGRMEPWRRAEALFGTNGIQVASCNFNSKRVRINCIELTQKDINPCLQALVTGFDLLPHADRFEVFIVGSPEPVVSVSRESLELALPIWEFASTALTSMPFSTFLPINMSSRTGPEDPRTAARSAAWIAVDDLLDALDGSPVIWDMRELKLFVKRVELVSLAIKQCMTGVPLELHPRLRAVREAALEILEKVRRLAVPVGNYHVANLQPVAKCRYWWNKWGPVDRLPTIEQEGDPQPDGKRPLLQDEHEILRWRTL